MYPFKKAERLNSKPYIKKEEMIQNHSYSCTYREYCEIIHYYLQEIIEDLFRGNEVPLKANLGFLKLVKYKSGTPIDWNMTNKIYGENNKSNKEKKFFYHKNHHTDGYRISVKWIKTKCKFKHKSFIRFRLSRSNNIELGRLLSNNLKLISNIDI